MSVTVTTNSRFVSMGLRDDQELLHYCIGRHARGVILLSGDQVAVNNGVRRPRSGRRVARAGYAQTILEQPGCVACKAGLSFFLVTKAGQRTVLEGPSTVLARCGHKSSRPVTHGSNDFLRVVQHCDEQ